MKKSSEKDFNPPVSVVIPCYNHGRYIREAIESVEQCDSRLYEIIVVNDGSTDPQTQRVMVQLESEGYHVISQENRGLAVSRNNAISAARGRYILPLDADNKIHPSYITIGIQILDARPEVGVVYGRPELFGDTAARNYPDVDGFDLHRLVISNYIDACAVVRKSALIECGLYDTHLPDHGWEDWDLWLTMATRGWQFHFENATLFSYRMLPGSLISFTSHPEELQRSREYLYRKHALLLRQVIIEQQTTLSDHPRALRYSRLWASHGFKGVVHEGLTEAARRLTGRFRRTHKQLAADERGFTQVKTKT